MTELLPCPFCQNDQTGLMGNLAKSGYAVHCVFCEYTYTWKSNKEAAIEAWNTRHKETEG